MFPVHYRQAPLLQTKGVRLQLGGLDRVLLHDRIICGDGQEVGQLCAGGELVEEVDGLPEMPPGPARLAQLPVTIPSQ